MTDVSGNYIPHEEDGTRESCAASDLLVELKRIAAVLPGPVWNEHHVLAWSMLDIKRLRDVIAQAER